MQCFLFVFIDRDTLTERFEYAHKKMAISHTTFCRWPELLYCRLHRLQQRHEYLLHLGKAQYNPDQELYVSFKRLVEGTDSEFVLNVAKSSFADYEAFLRLM